MTDFGSGPIVVDMLSWAAVTLALMAVAVGVRRLLRCLEPSTAAVDMADLTPVQLGYLRNGSGPAVAAALAGLRMRGLVGAETGRGARAVPAEGSAAIDPFHREIRALVETDEGLGVSDLGRRMKPQLRALERELIACGLHTPRAHRWLMGVAATPPALVAIGGFAFQMVTRSGAGIGWFWVFWAECAALVLMCFVVLDVPRSTPVGDAVLSAATRRWGFLKPSQRPAFATYGPDAAALSVALFGGAALWWLDPAFAERFRVGGSQATADSCGACGDAACGEPESSCGG
jgi:uncharacterized protein (TIGR04222 family)